MKIKLTTNKFNEDQLRDYMKIKFKYRDEWLGLLIARIRSYYLSYDKERTYDFITCDDIPFVLLDIDSSIVKDIDNDKYDYYVLYNEDYDTFEKEISEIIEKSSNENRTKIKIMSLDGYPESIIYVIARYNNDEIFLYDESMAIEPEMCTIFRFDKSTHVLDKLDYSFKNNKIGVYKL